MAIIGRVQIDRASREGLSRPSTLRTVDDLPVDVELIDLSTSGCLLSGAIEIRVGTMITIGIPGAGTHVARAIRRVGADVGCEFLHPLDPSVVGAAKMADALVEVPFPQSARPAPAQTGEGTADPASPLAKKIEWVLRYWAKLKER